MTRLKYGDKVELPVTTSQINNIVDVAPIRFDTIEESWVVCEQENATHMLIAIEVSNHIDLRQMNYITIEIGKCDNIYLLADAIVG